jgi:hypothetical protein
MAFLKTVGKRVARAAGRGAMATGRGAGRAAGSRAGVAAIAAGAFGLGVLNKAAPAARDAAFDVAFDDPDADVAFMGRKMSSRFLLGTAIGGPMGGALRYSAPSDLMATNPVSPAPLITGGVVGGGLIAGAGIATGAFKASSSGIKVGLGAYFGGESLGSSVKAGLAGFKPGLKSGAKTMLKGGVIGAAVGAAGIGLGALGVRSYVSNNQKFFNESPYAGRTSSSIANSMNSSGDIVLGMHNARRGY